MKLLLRILVPILILGGTAGVVAFMMLTKPKPQTRQPPPSVQAVDAIRLRATNFQVRIPSFGFVKPRTESTLKPEVSGRVLSISPNFRDGGFFEKGDLLVTIDPQDYESAVVVAKATLAQRESALQLEQAQHEQAVENWRLLGDGSDPSPLTLREPQLAEARANVDSARARLEEAERNLERTRIVAPYAGRILKKEVDVGQTVSPGNVLASIFAVDYVEVRLPLFNEQLDYIDLPEEYRGDAPEVPLDGPRVLLHGDYGSQRVTWEGHVIRAEGVYDTAQLFVVAQVKDPYARSGSDIPPLKVGQYVQAEILGHDLQDVYVIPRSAVRLSNEVLLVTDQNLIQRRTIRPIWRDEEHVIVQDNLKSGEVICITPMMFAADGAKVLPTIDGVPPPTPGPPPGQGNPGRRADTESAPGAAGSKRPPVNP